MIDRMSAPRKPIIGITGGIGSGKSFIADLFGEEACLVIKADDLVGRAYEDPTVQATLRQWWGDQVIAATGVVDRKAIAERVFNDEPQRKRLENLIHPIVATLRDRMMAKAADDPQVLAFIWDTPLLFETGLNRHCDAVVFVDAPFDLRLQRVQQSRGWDQGELTRRENLQLPLDRKRNLSDYTISNASDTADARRQVQEVLSRILSNPPSPR